MKTSEKLRQLGIANLILPLPTLIFTSFWGLSVGLNLGLLEHPSN